MKAKVVMPFKDKVTGKVQKTGAVIDVTPTRFAEIKKAGRFLVVEDKEEAEKK